MSRYQLTIRLVIEAGDPAQAQTLALVAGRAARRELAQGEVVEALASPDVAIDDPIASESRGA